MTDSIEQPQQDCLRVMYVGTKLIQQGLFFINLYQNKTQNMRIGLQNK